MVTVRRVTTDEQRADALAVRNEVFVEEQGVAEPLERDGKDDEASHVVAYDDGEPIGTARLRALDSTTAKIERVAVLESRRSEGIGREIMTEIERIAADTGFATVTVHSQTHVEAFYHELGYETVSDVFEEAGIDHVEMEKSLR